MATNIGGVINALLIDSNKIVCPHCNSTYFQVGFQMDSSLDMPADDPIRLYEEACESIVFLCQSCGRPFGKVAYLICNIAGSVTPALTMDFNITVQDANCLKGLYVIPLTDTDLGVAYKIVSNTKASPTVITVEAGINDDCVGLALITSFKPGV